MKRQRAFQREWMARRRAAWFAEHGPCVRCGSWDELHLHHRDPAEKVSHRIWSWTPDRRDAEAAKCDVLCRSCHEAHHAELKRTTPPCGTRARYNRGCHCAECRRAQAEYQTVMRKKHGYAPRVRLIERFCRGCRNRFVQQTRPGRPYSHCEACRGVERSEAA